jgi:hypothetical protein
MSVETLGGLTIDHNSANERPADPPVRIRAPIDTMPTGSFESSNVHSALYDFGTAELFVRYLRDGPDTIYQYDGVPPSTWEGLKQASSKGSYINANVAYSFTYTKLTSSDFPDEGRGLDNDLARRFVTDS